MKSIFILFLVLLSGSLAAQTGTQIGSAEITFVYLANDVDGSIAGFSSSSTIDLDNPTNSKFKGAVATKTLKSGNFLRDWSLKGRKYFDTDTYPRSTFESTSITETSDGFSVAGNLTIKKTTKPVTIDFKLDGKKLTGTTTLFSSDYGINVKKKKEDNKVSVKMAFVLK